jgi:anthranilate synthase component 1
MKIQKVFPKDHLTPIQCYQNVGGTGCCIFESAHDAKISMIGIRPIGTFRANGCSIEIEQCNQHSSFQGDPYDALRSFARDRKCFGFIGYDAIRLKEKLPDCHPAEALPDFFFHLYQTVIIFDHSRQTITITHEGLPEELDAIVRRVFDPVRLSVFSESANVSIEADSSRESFGLLVEQAKEAIRAGDIFQVVLSRTFQASVRSKPFDVYRSLRQTSPAPYHFFFEEKNFAIAGASPELLISVQDGVVESMPIAGTCERESGVDLLADPKERAEHMMLVDLARNDVGQVSEVGSVLVAELLAIKSFSHVCHIVSRVVGRLNPSLDALDAFKASFPAGTLSGAPKIRAMEIIDELENRRRGLYGGAIVFMDENGRLLSCIAIRTIVLQDGRASIRAGAGIVLDSNPQKEAEETEIKAQGALDALMLAEGGAV